MEEHGGHTYRSFVRGVPIDFSPKNIRTVMRFRAQVQGATTDFETRKKHDQQLDRVLADLCMPGAAWKLSTGQKRVPIQLRRSEIPVIRAILINCIINGEHIRAEDIIADKMVRMAQGIKEKGKLGFPRTIYKLCKEAGVPLREFRRTKKIQIEKLITARRMESTRLPRPIQHRQQDDEDEDQPMPQAEEENEEENEEGQGYERDYHHQPEFDHQPEYEHHSDFQEEPQVQQPPLYHVPTYTDQHEKDLHSIETQLQNMMWYQQQTLENISKSQAEYMAELREIKGKQQELYENNDRFYHQVREEQREMAKEIQQVKNYQEILDVKKYQMSAVTMGSGSSSSPTPQRYEPDQALIKIREQHANFSEMQRQLRDWTRNVSTRECYTVWAHQQANSNLVEMSSQKVVKQIYDNIDHKRPMFQGLLKTDLPPSDSAPPPSSSNDPKNPPK
ncbi:hypothetical protein PIB30_059654 [Stylosanthes scabra]|uniref:Putative plant transposon protein domain-containing protein n=1 Tax=Stylosanthes scabra TaxID=79078 RepID=A0ABU6SKB4_9FABA|nr:hypothetical protein [Stylosanthes scabra]